MLPAWGCLMAGTSWPTLTAGQIARASDVISRFQWLEGSLAPMTGGSQTDGVFDLGTTTANWRNLHVRSIAPTSTSKCVTVGTTTACTTTADSDASFEFAGLKSIILPRLSTTQINNLTAVDGMIAYNTTTSQLQIRKSGAWVNIGGPVYKAQAISITQLVNTATQTILNITSGGGRINGIVFKSAAANSRVSDFQLILDGNAIYATTATRFTSTSNVGWLNGAGFLQMASTSADFTVTAFQTSFSPGVTTGIIPGTFDFASTAVLYMNVESALTSTVNVCYSLIQ